MKQKRDTKSKKQKTISIDGQILSVLSVQEDFLKWMCGECFFREISPDVYLSQDRAQHNPLSGIYEQPLSDGSGLTTRVDQLSISQGFDEWLDNLCSSDGLQFVRLILISLLKLNPNFSVCPRRSEATESDSEGWRGLGGTAPHEIAASPKKKQRTRKPTVGSNSEGDNRNELPPIETPVKDKMKKHRKTVRYVCESDEGKDPVLEALAEIWLKWAHEKMPWSKEKFSVDKFYDALITIRNTTDLSADGLRAIFDFIRKDLFWKDQVVSPKSLLTASKNGLRKIDNVLLKFKKEYDKNRIFTDSEWKDPF